MKEKSKKGVTILLTCLFIFCYVVPVNASELRFLTPSTFAVKPLDSFTLSSNSQHNFGVFYLRSGTTVKVRFTASQLTTVEFLLKAPNGNVDPFGQWSTYGGTVEFTVLQTGNYTFLLNNYSAGSTTFYNVSIDY